MIKLTVASVIGLVGGAILGHLLSDEDGVDPTEVAESFKDAELAFDALEKKSNALEDKVARLEAEKKVHVKANHALQARADELESLAVRQAAENDNLKQELNVERTGFNDTATKLAATKREVRRLDSRLAQAATQVETVMNENAEIAEELRKLKSSEAQSSLLGVCSCLLKPKFDCDFRSINDIGKHFEVGGKPYIRPIGCQRFALNGTRCLVLVQVRVDPTKCTIAKAAGQGRLKDGEYWTVTDGDAIRPYAICLFEE